MGKGNPRKRGKYSLNKKSARSKRRYNQTLREAGCNIQFDYNDSSDDEQPLVLAVLKMNC